VSDPLVSILVPTYNGERFLRPALRSALEQSYRNIEVVVGDDASTDGTTGILTSVAAADPRVRVIRHEQNLGSFGNPIRLLQEARGEYVKFLLHDDVLASDCVRELVRGMQSSQEVTLAFSRRSLINEDGRPVPGHEYPALADRAGLLDGRQLGDGVLANCANLIGELTTVLFRRADVDVDGLWQVEGRHLDVLGDLKLHLMLLARGKAWYTPRVLSRFRSHPAQNSWNPRLMARGVRDWPRLIDWGIQQGFLADPGQQRAAFALALQAAAQRVGQLAPGLDHGPALEAVFLATARLVELGAGVAADPGRGLLERAHDRDHLDRFRQEIDVWSREHPAALAAAAAVAAEVDATVAAFREVQAAGVTKRFLLAVPPADLGRAASLLAAARAQGPDVDVELVPADDPLTLLDPSWLAVAARGSTWHADRAAAVWTVAGAPTA